jgi:hypothetical protein
MELKLRSRKRGVITPLPHMSSRRGARDKLDLPLIWLKYKIICGVQTEFYLGRNRPFHGQNLRTEELETGFSNNGRATQKDCEQPRDSLIVLALSHPPYQGSGHFNLCLYLGKCQPIK